MQDGHSHPYIQAYRSSQAWAPGDESTKHSETSVSLIYVRMAPWMARIEEEASSLTHTKKKKKNNTSGCGLQIAQNSPCDSYSWAIHLPSNNKMMNFEEKQCWIVAVCLCVSSVCLKFWPNQWEQSMAFLVCTQVVNFCAGRECGGVMIVIGGKVQLVQP